MPAASSTGLRSSSSMSSSALSPRKSEFPGRPVILTGIPTMLRPVGAVLYPFPVRQGDEPTMK
jgi:hypothetical protein